MAGDVHLMDHTNGINDARDWHADVMTVFVRLYVPDSGIAEDKIYSICEYGADPAGCHTI